jgi:hypothetical protein
MTARSVFWLYFLAPFIGLAAEIVDVRAGSPLPPTPTLITVWVWSLLGFMSLAEVRGLAQPRLWPRWLLLAFASGAVLTVVVWLPIWR